MTGNSIRQVALFFSLILAGRALSLPAQEAAGGGPWKDVSPHTSHLIPANGVTLHYLDWGGTGEPLLFLAGMCCTAHTFDELAPKLTDGFRVLGLTRRGFGRSERSALGYDTRTLVADILAFLDAMKIDRVTLAGHSLAGDELTWFAALHPDRVKKLVYLDAAYDYSDAPSEPIPEMKDLLLEVAGSSASLTAFRGLLKRRITEGIWSEAVEAEMREQIRLRPDGSVEVPDLPGWFRTAGALSKGCVESRPEYTRVKHPSLSFHAFRKAAVDSTKASPRELEYAEKLRSWQREKIDLFRKSGSHVRIVEMRDTPHFCFSREEDLALVVKEMKSFLRDG